jgi:imidazole glycerol-phosphate synthase subunit HisH
MVVIVDYGMGNLKSVYNAFRALDADVAVSSRAHDIEKAEKIILPGVGAFGDAMAELAKRELIDPLRMSIANKKPFLGICLGLQLLYEKSEENPDVEGLGIFPGSIRRFRFHQDQPRKVPHMGWNTVRIEKNDCPLMRHIPSESYFYFVHSYYAAVDGSTDVLATTDYGCRFGSMLWRDSVYAAQFHPEKSQKVGLKLLQNFLGL